MHLIFVTSIVPSGAPESGYEIANEAIIDGLRRQGVRITVIGYAWPGKPVSDPDQTIVLGEVDPRTDTASGGQKVRWLATALRHGLTFASAKLRTLSHSDLRSRIRSVGAFDGYVINAVQMAGAYPDLFGDRPYAYVAHNVEYLSARENAHNAKRPHERLLFRREARLLEAMERRLCSAATHVWTLAEDDLAPLGVRSGAGNVLTLVTPPAPVAARSSADIRYDAGLIGTWTWAPNRVGLDWFLGEIVPRLPAGVRIAVAGKAPEDLRTDIPGVTFLGRVADAKAFVRSCAVVPLVARAGTGVQLKSLETFEAGLPAVATPSSLRGIANIPANVAVADLPEAFASALGRAIADARTNGPRDVDGHAFRQAQIRALSEGLSIGIERLAAAFERRN